MEHVPARPGHSTKRRPAEALSGSDGLILKILVGLAVLGAVLLPILGAFLNWLGSTLLSPAGLLLLLALILAGFALRAQLAARRRQHWQRWLQRKRR